MGRDLRAKRKKIPDQVRNDEFQAIAPITAKKNKKNLMKKNTIYITMMCLFLVVMVPGSSAFGWVTLLNVVDDPDPVEIRTAFATHVGISIQNTSLTESYQIDRIGFHNLSWIGGNYGTQDSVNDIISRNVLGTIDSSGSLSNGLFNVNPGDIVYFSLQVNETRTFLDYDRGLYSGGPFEVDTIGSAAMDLDIVNHFLGGTFVGTAGTGMDDVGSWSFQTAVVPEPSTYALLMGGVALISIVSRRRR